MTNRDDKIESHTSKMVFIVSLVIIFYMDLYRLDILALWGSASIIYLASYVPSVFLKFNTITRVLIMLGTWTWFFIWCYAYHNFLIGFGGVLAFLIVLSISRTYYLKGSFRNWK